MQKANQRGNYRDILFSDAPLPIAEALGNHVVLRVTLWDSQSAFCIDAIYYNIKAGVQTDTAAAA